MKDSEIMIKAIERQGDDYIGDGDLAFSCVNVNRVSRRLGNEYTSFIAPHLQGKILRTSYEGEDLQVFRLDLMNDFRQHLIDQGR